MVGIRIRDRNDPIIKRVLPGFRAIKSGFYFKRSRGLNGLWTVRFHRTGCQFEPGREHKCGVPECETSFSLNGYLGSQEVAPSMRETVTVWRAASTLTLNSPSAVRSVAPLILEKAAILEVKASNHDEKRFATVWSGLPE